MPIQPPEQHMSMEKFMEWIDSDNDGSISKYELRRALKEQGFRFTKLKAWWAVKRVDRNSNRLVDPGEEIKGLVEYMRKHWNIVVDVPAP